MVTGRSHGIELMLYLGPGLLLRPLFVPCHYFDMQERVNPPFNVRKLSIKMHGSEKALLRKEKFMAEVSLAKIPWSFLELRFAASSTTRPDSERVLTEE